MHFLEVLDRLCALTNIPDQQLSVNTDATQYVLRVWLEAQVFHAVRVASQSQLTLNLARLLFVRFWVIQITLNIFRDSLKCLIIFLFVLCF
jgi:hypothetical protein